MEESKKTCLLFETHSDTIHLFFAFLLNSKLITLTSITALELFNNAVEIVNKLIRK